MQGLSRLALPLVGRGRCRCPCARPSRALSPSFVVKRYDVPVLIPGAAGRQVTSGDPFPRTIEDEELVFDKKTFHHDRFSPAGAKAASPRWSSNARSAPVISHHGRNLCEFTLATRTARLRRRNQQFAMQGRFPDKRLSRGSQRARRGSALNTRGLPMLIFPKSGCAGFKI